MPLLSGSRSSLTVVVRLESVFVPLHALVTRASYFRRRCARRRAIHKTDRYVLTNLNRSPWFPMQTRPRRTQCGVGADESFVTSAERGRARIPVVPLPQADYGAHLALAV